MRADVVTRVKSNYVIKQYWRNKAQARLRINGTALALLIVSQQ